MSTSIGGSRPPIQNQNGVLSIKTGDQNDKVNITPVRNAHRELEYSITINGDTTLVDASNIQEIQVDTGDGDDEIHIDNSRVDADFAPVVTRFNINIASGSGDDQVFAAARTTDITVLGGDGDDIIRTHTDGQITVNGGEGRDHLISGNQNGQNLEVSYRDGE